MSAWIILGLTVLISVVGFAWPPLTGVCLFRPYWWLRKRQYWSVVSNGFVHANFGHLLFNCLSYWFFAFPLQRVIGDARFGELYFVGLIASNVGTYFKHREDPAYACLGSSGAVLAVLFAAIIYFPHNSLFIFPLPIPIPAPLFAVLYLGYSFYASRHPVGRVNHEAHIDGALAGLAFVALTDWPVWQHTLRGWM
jgi:membrane associated rhomboid family serine protease